MRRLIMISTNMYTKEMPMCKIMYFILPSKFRMGMCIFTSYRFFFLHNMLRSRVGPPVVILLSRTYNNK